MSLIVRVEVYYHLSKVPVHQKCLGRQRTIPLSCARTPTTSRFSYEPKIMRRAHHPRCAALLLDFQDIVLENVNEMDIFVSMFDLERLHAPEVPAPRLTGAPSPANHSNPYVSEGAVVCLSFIHATLRCLSVIALTHLFAAHLLIFLMCFLN